MILVRFNENPILGPNSSHSWEAKAAFNGSPTLKKEKIFLLYRAVSLPSYRSDIKKRLEISQIGIAESKDGIHFKKRKRFITPQEEWEKFGCEDPRVTNFEGEYYIFYTALSKYPFQASGIKIGLAISEDLTTIKEKHLVTPFNAKAMALFPERIKGKIWGILTVHTDQPPADIALINFNKKEEVHSATYWQKWYKNYKKFTLNLKRSSLDHIEVGTQPIKTKKGWLLFYSYIQNYFHPDPNKRIFSIEAFLLDLKNPLKILAKTEFPLMIPEEFYEKIGYIRDVIFPSGAIEKDGIIYLYYGSADSTLSLALAETEKLLKFLLSERKNFLILKRAKNNPIITPNKNNEWESKATFNPGAILIKNKIHLFYRAMSEDNASQIGYAILDKDGKTILYRSPEPVYSPRKDFESKLKPGANSGCEDPRLTRIGEKVYMLYTAYDGLNPPRVALTWIKVEDILNKKWNWAEPFLISPPYIDDKDAYLFPEKIRGKYIIVHRSGDDIDLAFLNKLPPKKGEWLEEYRWIMPRKGMWDSKKVGGATPPLKTKEGWIMFYHGISEQDNTYRVGAVLLDLEDPTKIIARTIRPIFEPETTYEKFGIVNNVVFPCGAVMVGKKIFIYYGGADKVVGMASLETEKLIKLLKEQ